MRNRLQSPGRGCGCRRGNLAGRAHRDLSRHPKEQGGIRRDALRVEGDPAFGKGGGYEDLCREIGKFFKTGQAPVALDETLEVMAFMEAADESKRQGGRPVSLKSLIEKARAAGAP